MTTQKNFDTFEIFYQQEESNFQRIRYYICIARFHYWTNELQTNRFDHIFLANLRLLNPGWVGNTRMDFWSILIYNGSVVFKESNCLCGTSTDPISSNSALSKTRSRIKMEDKVRREIRKWEIRNGGRNYGVSFAFPLICIFVTKL